MAKFGRPVAAFCRCEKQALERLAGLGTALVTDAMGRFGALDSRIAAQWPDARLHGNAFTVWTRAGDNLGIHQALDVAAPGDVVIVNGERDEGRALIGEMIGIKAKARGIAGFVLDGAARDIDALRILGVPVFARAATPAGPFKHGPFQLLQPTAVGGVCVFPGDAVIADRDGVAVVARSSLDETLTRADELASAEADKRIANAKPIR
ncbi:methyltransferase [Mycobacterium sp. 236(2023)]|nr:methyltransferase [Mycobacterium sp. 236(2023)]MDG4668151.1 methyltransferase [Mycobacterium sp. 236(2023)]